MLISIPGAIEGVAVSLIKFWQIIRLVSKFKMFMSTEVRIYIQTIVSLLLRLSSLLDGRENRIKSNKKVFTAG